MTKIGHRPNNGEPDSNRAEIMIVEDSPTQAAQLQDMLERNGYAVLVADNGKRALELIDSHRPSIIISDIVMPEMDGYMLCEAIKKNPSLRDVPVMLLTSLIQPDDVIRALQCGADKFFTKPYDEAVMLSTIQSLFLDSCAEPACAEPESIEFSYRGQRHPLSTDRMQVISLLISTYEAAVIKNMQLITTQDQLEMANKDLEERVLRRTADLQAKSEELNAMSRQLWQAAKLATMGELTASIAHELNNPLATVSLRIESMMEQLSEDDPRRHEFTIIGHEVERMATLVANLLQFGRRSQRQVSTLDLCEEIEKTLELIEHHLRNHRIELVRDFVPGIPKIHADRQQVRQLLLNLFTNASDAMPQGGTLRIGMYVRKEAGNGAPPAALSCSSPDCLVIEVGDTGTGIPPEILPKVMDPFFTTKGEDKGTGLGLAICKRVMNDHGGILQIRSSTEPHRSGTTVSVTFPLPSPDSTTVKGGNDE